MITDKITHTHTQFVNSPFLSSHCVQHRCPQYLCRGGNEAVQATFELDVVRVDQSEDGSGLTGDLQRGGSVRAVSTQHKSCGKLHLRIANIGHTVESKKVAGECVDVILGWGWGWGGTAVLQSQTSSGPRFMSQ